MISPFMRYNPSPNLDALSRRRSWLLAMSPAALGILVFGLVIALMMGLRYTILLDDAFISLRYARNLFEGHGPVYNPGEEPVEGYTNFLWMLFMSVHFFFTKHPEHLMLFWNRLFGLLIVVVVWWELLRRGEAGHRWLWLGVGLVACHETLHAWMAGGLETHFFTFLVAVATGRFLREEFTPLHAQRPWSAIPMALALLTRPEAYMLGLILGSVLIFRRLVFAKGVPGAWKGWRRVLIWGGVCAVIGGTHLLWRHAYYGAWLPNTFYAKVPGAYFENGIPYVRLYLDINYLHWMILAFCGLIGFIAVVFQRHRPISGQIATLCLLTAGMCLYLAYTGGDVFEFRLLAPTIPFIALLVPLSFEAISGWLPSRDRWEAIARPLVLALLTLLGGTMMGRAFYTSLNNPHVKALGELKIAPAIHYQLWNWESQWHPVGEWLREFADPDERLAIGAAGVVPYVSGLPTFDILGLNDREVAHMEVSGRGGVGHEKKAGWELIKKRGTTYFIDDLGRRDKPTDFPDWLRKDENAVIVKLLTDQWLSIKAPNGAQKLRESLRERGAIVYPGPKEDAAKVNPINKANEAKYTAIKRRLDREKK
ncbi:hypothetical protein KQI84_08540 [bacterium]|nr:hypothetical protein [bacterium]